MNWMRNGVEGTLRYQRRPMPALQAERSEKRISPVAARLLAGIPYFPESIKRNALARIAGLSPGNGFDAVMAAMPDSALVCFDEKEGYSRLKEDLSNVQ